MKKLLLASAVAALSVSAAQAAPTVYGKAFLTLDIIDGDTDVTTTTYDVNGNQLKRETSTTDVDGRSRLNSNSSRIGFRGSEALTANTDLVYQLEYGIDVDSDGNDSDQFYARDTYMGFANDQYGTLVAGRLTAIDDYINYANVSAGDPVGGDNVLASFDAPRANNTFAYFSPEYNDVQFMGMYVMDEYDEETVDFGPLTRDAYGIGAKYEPANSPLRAGATYIQAGEFKTARVSGAYDINQAVTLAGQYQLTDFDTDDNENAFTLSGEMKTATPWTVYAQGDVVTNVLGEDDADKFRVLGGGKYAFNQNTTGHLYAAYLNQESTKWDGTGLVRTESDGDSYGIGGGIEYKF